jgi:acetyl/propionyl-CoA carboxylase alpha subunit
MFREPAGPGIRVDAGVIEGSDVSVFYDPLLAKLIVCGETREAAIARATAALKHFIILGIRTNIPFLLNILDSREFNSGDVHTGFLDAEGARLRVSQDAELSPAALAAVAFHQDAARASPGGAVAPRRLDPFETIRGWTVR